MLLCPSRVQADVLDGLTVPAERRAVQKCLSLLAARRLERGNAKGAFCVAPNAPKLWVEHYFALEATLALLAASDDAQSKYVQWVGEYLTFYARDALRQPQGVAHNLEGPLDDLQPLVPVTNNKGETIYKDYDSIDAYAGLFLLASARYYKLTGQLPPDVREAALVSLRALDRTINDKDGVVRDGGATWTFSGGAATNGLSIARAQSPMHFLIDAIESHAGLRAAEELFQHIGRPAEAQQAKALADGIVRGSALFAAQSGGELYACQVDNGNIAAYQDTQYPGILANLFALAYLPEREAGQHARLWQFINQNQSKIGHYTAEAPIERWLIAANRVETDVGRGQKFRQDVATTALNFNASTYIDRIAVSILALLDKSAHYPLVASDKP